MEEMKREAKGKVVELLPLKVYTVFFCLFFLLSSVVFFFVFFSVSSVQYLMAITALQQKTNIPGWKFARIDDVSVIKWSSHLSLSSVDRTSI